jgi:hypothetical protein
LKSQANNVSVVMTAVGGIYRFLNTGSMPFANDAVGWSVQVDAKQGLLARTQVVVPAAPPTINIDQTPTIDIEQTPVDGQSNNTLDFGFQPLVVGGRVIGDDNRNGLLDNDEMGLSDIEIQLWIDTPAKQIGTTTTDVNGIYRFLSTDTVSPYLLPTTAVRVLIPY